MKRVKVIFCFCLAVLTLCSCSRKDQEFLEPANFYYCNQAVSYNSPTGVIRPEIKESQGFEKDIEKYMEEYLRGPVSDELYMIIPQSTSILSANLQGNIALLDFSKSFADLSGIELTTAGVCIMKSLNEFAGVEMVMISADNALLDEKEFFTLSLEDIVMMDTVTMEE